MTISVGDTLPDATFFEKTADGLAKVTTAEVFGGRKIALLAVPGAFTGTCHLKHLPPYVALADEIKAKGIDEIVCITVNDPHVALAWAESLGAVGLVRILTDAEAEFTKAIGMAFDGSAGGLATRSKRYSALVEDGVVTAFNLEESPGQVEVSGAEDLLKAL